MWICIPWTSPALYCVPFWAGYSQKQPIPVTVESIESMVASVSSPAGYRKPWMTSVTYTVCMVCNCNPATFSLPVVDKVVNYCKRPICRLEQGWKMAASKKTRFFRFKKLKIFRSPNFRFSGFYFSSNFIHIRFNCMLSNRDLWVLLYFTENSVTGKIMYSRNFVSGFHCTLKP